LSRRVASDTTLARQIMRSRQIMRRPILRTRTPVQRSQSCKHEHYSRELKFSTHSREFPIALHQTVTEQLLGITDTIQANIPIPGNSTPPCSGTTSSRRALQAEVFL